MDGLGKKSYENAGLKPWLLLLAVALVVPSMSFAAHPLVTDDAGTVGKGRTQIEINSEIGSDKETDEDVETEEIGTHLSTIITYGVTDTVDVVVGLPYLWSRTKENGDTVHNENGLSDISVEVKRRFYEKDGLNLALKPGITLPTGNHRKGLGVGRPTYGLTFTATKEIEPFAFHFNAGYLRNENKVDERKDIWFVSIAGEAEVFKGLKVVGNIGAEQNPDKTSITRPAFALAGLIYSVAEHIDLDVGFKVGINKAEIDHSLLFGIALKF